MPDAPANRLSNPPSPAPFRFVRFLGCLFFACLFLSSIGLNIFLLVAFLQLGDSLATDGSVREKLYAGPSTAADKIAVVQLNGVLMEGLNGFMHKEIDHAAEDAAVKAVVLRINSPGGTITASDELYRRLVQLRDGDPIKKTPGKPLVVSMGSVAASGGYYIAMPAKTLIAERTTVTGSIGVYAAFPNVTELGKKVGFSLTLFRAGDVKDSGSPFRDMTEKERNVWQAMVDHAYLQFLHVVEEGRPKLKGQLQLDLPIDETLAIRDENSASKHVKYTRYRADGGIFTADAAKKYGLIDEIGYLDDAIKAARQAANLGENCQVVEYQKPPTLLGSLLGIKARPPESVLEPSRLANAAVPRLWYLAPQSELAGTLTSMAGTDAP